MGGNRLPARSASAYSVTVYGSRLTRTCVSGAAAVYYVYILRLNNDQLYTRYCGDLKRRMAEHHAGKSPFTSQRLPVQLVHYEAYSLESDARRRERFLKTTEGKRLLRQQIRDLLATFSQEEGSPCQPTGRRVE